MIGEVVDVNDRYVAPPHLGVELRGEPVEVRRVAEIAAVVFGHGEDGEEVQDVAERREAHVIIICTTQRLQCLVEDAVFVCAWELAEPERLVDAQRHVRVQLVVRREERLVREAEAVAPARLIHEGEWDGLALRRLVGPHAVAHDRFHPTHDDPVGLVDEREYVRQHPVALLPSDHRQAAVVRDGTLDWRQTQCRAERRLHLVIGTPVERVAALRPVDRDDRDMVAHLIEHAIEFGRLNPGHLRHAFPPLAPLASAKPLFEVAQRVGTRIAELRTAVAIDNRAGDVFCIVRREEERRIGDIRLGSIVPQGDPRLDRLLHFFLRLEDGGPKQDL